MDDWLILEKIEDVVGTRVSCSYENARLKDK